MNEPIARAVPSTPALRRFASRRFSFRGLAFCCAALSLCLLGCSSGADIGEPPPLGDMPEPEPQGTQQWTRFLQAGTDAVRLSTLVTDTDRNIYAGGAVLNEPGLVESRVWLFDEAGQERTQSLQPSRTLWPGPAGTIASLSYEETNTPDTLTRVLRHYQSDGNMVLLTQLPSLPARVYKVMRTSDGGFVMVGADKETGDLSDKIVQIARYGPSGELGWSIDYGEMGTQICDADIDGSDQLYLLTHDDNFSQPGQDICRLSIFDGEGAQLTSPVEVCGFRMTVSPQGEVTVMRSLNNESTPEQPTPANLRMCRYDQAQQLMWSHEAHRAGHNPPWVTDVSTDRWGNILATGYQWMQWRQSSDMWTRKYAPDGTLLWEDRFTDTIEQGIEQNLFHPAIGLVVTADSHGAVLVGGWREESGNMHHVLRKLAP